MFDGVESFCLFVGYPRSGHSLVGSVLDASPETAIAHEADVLRLFSEFRLSRARIFKELFDNARRQAHQESGRTQSGYLYEVPGQWQGRVSRLKVIGDKSGGESVRRLAADPSELRKFAEFLGIPVRLIHIVRNPFDTVARLSLVTKHHVPKRTLSEALTLYEVYAVVNAALVGAGEFEILTLRHEEFVSDPRRHIRRVCDFVEVESSDDYVEAAAGIIWDAPQQTRDKIEWTEGQVERVKRLIDRYDFYHGYSFAN